MFNYVVHFKQMCVAPTQVNSTIEHFFIMATNANSQTWSKSNPTFGV